MLPDKLPEPATVGIFRTARSQPMPNVFPRLGRGS